ncbi:MAG: HAD-IA family hydrolase [Roseibium sp.]
MFDSINAVVWDFDGVLNRNRADGRFVWADTIESDLGIDLIAFEFGIFNPRFIDVISGKTDLLDHVQAWLDQTNHDLTAQQLLEYWFEKDDLKDPETIALLDQLRGLGIAQVIATNNEDRRCSYIEDVSGFRHRTEYVFSSGRIGHAKPDSAFFNTVSTELGVSPANILLIDDSAPNVRAAAALGWETFHFTERTRTQLATFLGL